VKESYPKNISIIATVFIFLILFLALVNLFISIQFRNEFIQYDRDKITTIASLCSHYLMHHNGAELQALLKNVKTSYDLEHLVISDTLGNLVYDSWTTHLAPALPNRRVDYSKNFKEGPEPGALVQNGKDFIYFNPEPPFYLHVALVAPYQLTYDRIFKWHISYITLSLIFIGFLGIFLIRNLFLPMRYVTNIAKDLGIEMKKEDFVSETFSEIFKKMKLKEETLVEFSSYVAHEFRNSIGAIIGLARLVEKGKKPASDIVKECRTMEDLINKLLDYSRPLKALSTPINVEQLVDDAIKKSVVPARIEIRKNINTDQPQLNGDYELLLIALTNLLKNSIEAIKKVGFIEIEVGEDEGFISISVTDSGPGIKETELEKIFSPFYSKKEEGMGLGLAYVNKIMEIHNGRVEVTSKKGQGATFTLKLPIV